MQAEIERIPQTPIRPFLINTLLISSHEICRKVSSHRTHELHREVGHN